MSAWLIALCGLAYLWVCVEQVMQGNWPMAMVYAGYCFANAGLILAMK